MKLLGKAISEVQAASTRGITKAIDDSAGEAIGYMEGGENRKLEKIELENAPDAVANFHLRARQEEGQMVKC